MRTLTNHYTILSERIKEYLRMFGPQEPEEIMEKLHHRYPPIVPFTVYTMLFSGALKINGFGQVVLPNEPEYKQEATVIHPIFRRP